MIVGLFAGSIEVGVRLYGTPCDGYYARYPDVVGLPTWIAIFALGREHVTRQRADTITLAIHDPSNDGDLAIALQVDPEGRRVVSSTCTYHGRKWGP